jgi:hypothetical protein
MRLIQDDGLRARQQIAEAFVLECEIGQQQVVIHDHDVGGLRVAPRLEHVAASELRTLLAQAVFTRRGNVRPERRLLRQIGEFRQIARLGGRRPACHPREHARHAALARQQGALLGRKFQSVPAQIVGPSLEQGDLDRQSERLRQQRNVAAKQLVLQRARAGGDDHAAPRQQRRNQVSEGLARARARLDDQGLEPRQRRAHGLGHGGLLGAVRIARQGARQRSLEVEDIVVVAVHPR